MPRKNLVDTFVDGQKSFESRFILMSSFDTQEKTWFNLRTSNAAQKSDININF